MYEIHNLQKQQLDYIKKQFKDIKTVTYQPAVKDHSLMSLIPKGGHPEDTLGFQLKDGRKIMIAQANDIDYGYINLPSHNGLTGGTIHDILVPLISNNSGPSRRELVPLVL